MSVSPRDARPDLSTPVWLALVALIGVAALLVRVVDLAGAPPGLHFDQAANGLLGLEILSGREHPVFFPSYTGREALFMYLIAALSRVLGPGVVALRLAGALSGAATVVAVAFLGASWFNRRVGLVAAAFLAGLYWHLQISRLGERTILVPLLDTLALLALGEGFRRRSAFLTAAGGALVGLQLYTYPSSRFFILALGLIVLLDGLSSIFAHLAHLGERPSSQGGAPGIKGPSGQGTTSNWKGAPEHGHSRGPEGPLQEWVRAALQGRGEAHGTALPLAAADPMTTAFPMATADPIVAAGQPTPVHSPQTSPTTFLELQPHRLRKEPARGHDTYGWGAVALLAVAIGAAVLVAVPLAVHFLHAPDEFLGRADQVAIWNARAAGPSPLAAFLRSAKATLLMFVVQGDADWKYNLANRPVFDPISAGLFLLGLAGCLRCWRDRASRAVLIWWGGMLVPGFLSVDAPQFMRTLGAAPPAVLVAARGLELLTGWVYEREGKGAADIRGGSFRGMPLLGYPRLPSLTLILWAWPVVAGGLATYQYFHVWAPSPAAYLALEGDVTAAATVIQSDTPRYAATYVASRYGPNPTISFLDGAEFGRLRWFDGRVALPLPPPGAGPTLYVLPRTAVDPSWYTRLPAADRVALIAAPDTGPGVEAFVLRPDELGPSHPLEAPVDFGGAARLIGADVPRVWQAGVATSPTFYWQVDRPPSGEVKFWAHLVDASGFTWAQYDEVAYPAAEWQPGQTLIVRHALAVPDVAPPGAYTLSVGLERLDGSALGASDSSGKSLGNAWTSTTVDLARPAHPPDPTALKPGRALDVTFGSSVRLFGATLDQSQARDGDDLSLTLFWQVLRAPGPVNLSLRLAGSTGAPFAELTRSPMNGRWPATDWRAGDVVVDREVVHLPVGAPAGPATISVGVRDASGVALPGSGGGDVVPVASLTVQRRPLSRAPVAIAHPQVVSFQGSPWLVGYDVVPTRVHPGETVHLTLYWQADQPIDRSWTVFTHLLREGDQVVAQEDGVPARGQRPTTTWEPGEIITDPHDLTVDPGAPPGSDHLEIGLYDVRTGQRRSLTVGGDRVLLDLPIEVLKSGG